MDAAGHEGGPARWLEGDHIAYPQLHRGNPGDHDSGAGGDGGRHRPGEHREELEHYEQMFGRDRGRLAVSLDRLTNALVLVGQHAIYCTSQRNPTVPAMDLRIINQELVHAKELVQSVMEELRLARAKKES